MQPNDSRSFVLRDGLVGQLLLGTGGIRYRLGEPVGEGLQGWVFAASRESSDDASWAHRLVVKVLRPDAVSEGSLGRFSRDASVLRMLGEAADPNPHIVRFFDWGRARVTSPGGAVDLPYTVLEHVHGTTLERVLLHARGVGLPLARIRRVAAHVALALAETHAHAVVHRDLKPSNILLTSANEPEAEVARVTDFGLVNTADVSLARNGRLGGVGLGYLPPEEFEQGQRRVGPRTDVFSFAAILYEMLSGTKAFPHGDGEDPLVIVTRLLNAPRPRLAIARGALSPELDTNGGMIDRLDAIFARGMAAEPDERHATITELWEALDALLRVAEDDHAARTSAAATSSTLDAAFGLELQRAAARRDGVYSPVKSSAYEPETAVRVSPSPPEAPDPASWKWRLCSGPRCAGFVTAAAFRADGSGAFGLGPNGLLRWDGENWSTSQPALGFDVADVRGMEWLTPAELLVFGAHGLAARLVPTSCGSSEAAAQLWNLPDSGVTLLGAFADPQGHMVTLVGERPAPPGLRGGGQAVTMGTIAQFARGKLMLVADAPTCARLRAVTRLRAGEIVACGDWGALVRLELGAAVHAGSICDGHLHAIAALANGGALTVGAGGHALSLSPRLEAQLEAVQTTRDLRALAFDPSGAPWAGSAQARLLRREARGWVRMSSELGLSSSVIALWAAAAAIRAICDDGAVIEGTVTSA
ncbi:MAG: serine/threonine protein kinase [Myxococcota bacterium]|nr:serine/threonine protein kinase [Myxococcota bacterium]